jgi:DNA-binding SARP family transcriptional activator
MEFRLLGLVEARSQARVVALGGPRQRAMLAMLLLRANHVVPKDELIDGIWGERPPKAAAAAPGRPR